MIIGFKKANKKITHRVKLYDNSDRIDTKICGESIDARKRSLPDLKFKTV